MRAPWAGSLNAMKRKKEWMAARASVASSDAIVPFRFQVIEKRGNERSIDIGEE